MFFKNILMIACLVALASASPRLLHYYEGEAQNYHEEPLTLQRHVRSPGDGSVQIDYNQDRFGKTAGVQYNQNVYKSSDGRLTVDAYARGSRDFTHNRNDYGGGVQGTYHFG